MRDMEVRKRSMKDVRAVAGRALFASVRQTARWGILHSDGQAVTIVQLFLIRITHTLLPNTVN